MLGATVWEGLHLYQPLHRHPTHGDYDPFFALAVRLRVEALPRIAARCEELGIDLVDYLHWTETAGWWAEGGYQAFIDRGCPARPAGWRPSDWRKAVGGG